jgi:hypothetical protein
MLPGCKPFYHYALHTILISCNAQTENQYHLKDKISFVATRDSITPQVK